MSQNIFWLVIDVHSAQFDSLNGPIAIDAYPDEQQARDEAERLAALNPGVEYGLFALIGTCIAPPAKAVWEESEV